MLDPIQPVSWVGGSADPVSHAIKAPSAMRMGIESNHPAAIIATAIPIALNSGRSHVWFVSPVLVGEGSALKESALIRVP